MIILGITEQQWNSHWMNRQHMMWAMKDFTSVLYVQSPQTWNQSRKTRDENYLLSKPISQHTQLRTLKIAKCLATRARPGTWNKCVMQIRSHLIKRCIPRGENTRVLYLWEPHLLKYADIIPHDILIYHMYDWNQTYTDPTFLNHPLQQQFHSICQKADLILAGTPYMASVIPRNDVVIFPNGVHFDWYRNNLPEPDDLREIGHPRIGYIGSINAKIDFEWFTEIAKNTSWQLILAGIVTKTADKPLLKQLTSLKNVHFLGLKPPHQIPQYLTHLDLGLLNYRRGLHCEFASPLKLSEYSAAGLPIVGTPIKAMYENPDAQKLVRFANTAAEAVVQIEKALSTENKENRQFRRDFAKRNSWSARCQELLSLIQGRLNTSSI